MTQYPQIIEAIQKDKLVFFIGAGMSHSLGFPSWRELVMGLLDELSKSQANSNVEFYKSGLDLGEFSDIEVLEKLKEEKHVIYNYMDKIFVLDGAVKEDAVLERHKKLSKISSKMITTNYDQSLEIANPQLTKVVYDNSYRVAKLTVTNNYILKLHGCISDPTKCILFEEDYKCLYEAEDSTEKAPIEELRKIIADHTIIFLGFSLTDPYVKNQFEYIHAIYQGLKGKHYIVTTSDEKLDIQGIEPISIADWDEGLDQFLDGLEQVKTGYQDLSVSIASPPHQSGNKALTVSVEEKLTSVAMLIASPLDKDYDYDFETITKNLAKFSWKIDYFYLSVEKLHELEGYEYIFIFSKAVRNQIVVEDQYIISNQVTIEELADAILEDGLKGVFLFLDKEIEVLEDRVNVTLPIVVSTLGRKKNYLSEFLFQVFRKRSLVFLEKSSQSLFNVDKLQLTGVKQGKGDILKIQDSSLKHIDHKQVSTFVGRKTDLETIVRKIVDLNSRVLTIKGSGGLGKTTIIKKAAVELFKREHFKADQVYFIDCEFILDYLTFEYKVAQCFGIESSLEFKHHVRVNQLFLDETLIILDNFESVLQVTEREHVIGLVSFICDYTKVVVTSREWIEVEFEDRYEIRAFTTDEAVELFQKYYKGTIRDSEIKVLREDILENLLNNNPLAIKIISNNLSTANSMASLNEDLENDFFSTTQRGDTAIFSEDTDRNIERSSSLFHSINYSYSKLNSKEQLVIKILSLFPDGINTRMLQDFFKDDEFKRDIYKITDREIRSLENKSLIETSKENIKLQSIVGRFADNQLGLADAKETNFFYQSAFQLNSFILAVIEQICGDSESTALEIFDQFTGNFLKCLEYIDQIDNGIPKDRKLSFVSRLSYFFKEIEQTSKFVRKIERLKEHFHDVEFAELLFHVMICDINYYEGDFELSHHRMEYLIPFEQVIVLDHGNWISQLIINRALNVYQYGKEFEILKYVIQRRNFSWRNLRELFSIGAYEAVGEVFGKLKIKVHYVWFDLLFNQGQLNIQELEAYIEQLFEKQYVEIMQSHYIKAKAGYMDRATVKKLVVTNPYTRGLKKLMFAFLEVNQAEATKLYKEAIEALQHIRYYYTEAIYYFSKYMKDMGSDEYHEWFEKGYQLASDHKYRFLTHQFECLQQGNDEPYDEDKYELPNKPEIRQYIEDYISYHSSKN